MQYASWWTGQASLQESAATVISYVTPDTIRQRGGAQSVFVAQSATNAPLRLDVFLLDKSHEAAVVERIIRIMLVRLRE